MDRATCVRNIVGVFIRLKLNIVIKGEHMLAFFLCHFVIFTATLIGGDENGRNEQN